MGEQARRVTLQDVALAAGVSTGTASQALNGSPVVRAATRARVLAVAQRLDYVPDRNASRLLHGRTECIGVAFVDASWVGGDGFYALVVRGITDALEEHGYTTRFIRLDEKVLAAPRGGGRSLSGRDVDGLLVLNWLESAIIERMRAAGVPLVVVDASSAVLDLPTVDNDDRGGAALAVRHLLGLGHRQIALLNLALHHPFGREALAGYLQAFEEQGAEVAPWLLRSCAALGITAGRQAMAELLSAGRLPTAIFAVADELAVGAMQAIQEAGLRIPDDLSVVSMDDIPLAAEVRPALTTVHIDLEELGRQATELLLNLIAGRAPERLHTVLPTHLVVRGSTAAPPLQRRAMQPA